MADWALILGASSGFGEATSLRLADDGFNILGVHLDRRAGMANVERIISDIERRGRKAVFFNVNAADAEKRKEVIDGARAQVGTGETIRVMMHSLAFGTLKPFITDTPADALEQRQLEMTLDVMANSLVYWAQDVVAAKLMGPGGRIFAMTSAGSSIIWKSYGAVSAAKCSLEHYCRQLAVELAPHKITANAILAGVTDTPALRKIPGHEGMIEDMKRRNPYGRLTEPNDVAQAISLLARPESHWITGNVIRVDGAENISG